MGQNQKKNKGLTASFLTGAIALIFLVIGYEVALFVHRASVTSLVAKRDHPDTVYVMDPALAEEIWASDSSAKETGLVSPSHKTKVPAVRRSGKHSPAAVAVREKFAPRPVESFRFNPNTVSIEDLQRLGFSEKQAQAIDNYRKKGGRFRRRSDFAKSFVVADSVYQRLQPFIDIPLLDINKADSVALLDLPGIGPYFAGKIVWYRERLQGYSSPQQLLEIHNFGEERYDGLKDLITCSSAAPYQLWSLAEDELSKHPHISRSEAHSIVLFRQHHAPAQCTLEALIAAGTLSPDHATALSRCHIAPAQ